MMNMLFSDSESNTDSSDSEDQEDVESIYGGHAQRILSSLEETIGKIDVFLAFERGFVHGDIVCSVTDSMGQMGRVMDVDITLDLESTCGEIVKDVNSKKLLKIGSFAEGDYVVCGPWLGRVGRVDFHVTVLFDDGAQCEVPNADVETLISVSPNLLEDAQYPYYPGQRVRIRRSAVFKTARWLYGAWKASRDEGTVCQVEVGPVYVNWIASVVAGCEFTFPAPPCLQDKKNLTLLSCFPYANWQLGDWCILPNCRENVGSSFTASQSVEETVENMWESGGATQGFELQKKLGKGQFKRVPDYDQAYGIVRLKSKVDVLWQDGNLSIGLDSHSLLPINNISDHDFWPGQFVSEKVMDEVGDDSDGKRVGIVKNVDAKERTVKVNWMIPVPNVMFDSNRKFSEEILSAYELFEHPDYSYCLGDIVFRLFPHSDILEGSLPALKTLGMKQNPEVPIIAKDTVLLPFLGENILDKKHSCEGHDQYEKGFLAHIGNVIGFKDGNIEVRWASGLISKVRPHEIVGIGRDEDPASGPVLYDDGVKDNTSQSMSEYEKDNRHKQEKDLLVGTAMVDGQDCKRDLWDAGALGFPRAALGFLTNFATSIFGSRGSTSLSGMINCSYSADLDKNYNPDMTAVVSKDFKVDYKCENPNIDEAVPIVDDLKVDTTPEKTEEYPSSGDNLKLIQFKHFDIVGDYSDHHFINGAGHGLNLSQPKRGWLKKVQQEWSILQNSLPDTIYVRVYEERIDLLRAAIVGARGTPYHDGLFFFDIFFPADYPYEPPLVHYNSGGLRLNPNLYESGRVCLSLLKTWTGTGSEVWNPTNSTILQVLVSLQALVLNEKPYFNEAGYEKQIGRAEGEKNSMAYNENAFLLSCKSVLYLLRKPPKHFEALVEEHFSEHAHCILHACKGYMDGAQVGGYVSGDGMVVGQGDNSSSVGFKIMLAKLFPKLVSAFSERGINCTQFVDQDRKGYGPGT